MRCAKLEKWLISAIVMLSVRKRVVQSPESLGNFPKGWDRTFGPTPSGQIAPLC